MSLSARHRLRLRLRRAGPKRLRFVARAGGLSLRVRRAAPKRSWFIAKAAGLSALVRRGAPKRSRFSAKAGVLAIVVAAVGAAACNGRIFGKQYEYEEDLSLSLDGSATLTVNASIPALAALRGLPLDPGPAAQLDLAKVRAAYESPVTTVTRLTQWRRAGRRFVQVRLEIGDIRKLSDVAPLSWSRYQLGQRDGRHVFEQRVGASSLRPGTLQNVGWKGNELVGFRLHLPSRIIWHNSRDLETDGPREVARGNILAWEQRLADRLDGAPLDIKVEMDSQSILHRTLWLFGGAFAAALAVLALLIWFTIRKGAGDAATTATGP